MTNEQIKRLATRAGVGTVLLTAILTVLVLVLGPPLRRGADTLTPLTAWATYATAIGTLLLVVGAFIAALRIGEQIDQQEQAHRTEMGLLRRTYLLSIRPLLAISDAEFNGGQIHLQIQNVGLGPATNVVLRLWLFPTEDRVTDIETLVRTSEGTISATDPAVKEVIPGVAAGGDPVRLTLRANTAKGWDGGRYTQGYIVYTFETQDGLGDRHSTNAPWNPGFIRVSPKGGVDIA